MKMEVPFYAFRADGPYSIRVFLWNGYVLNQN